MADLDDLDPTPIGDRPAMPLDKFAAADEESLRHECQRQARRLSELEQQLAEMDQRIDRRKAESETLRAELDRRDKLLREEMRDERSARIDHVAGVRAEAGGALSQALKNLEEAEKLLRKCEALSLGREGAR